MKYNCLVIIKKDNFHKVRPFLNENIVPVVKQNLKEVRFILRTNPIDCAILYIRKQGLKESGKFFSLKERFPTIPFVVILAEKCLETARECGKTGMEKVIHFSEINSLNEVLLEAVKKKAVKVTLTDIGLQEENRSKILTSALKELESNYIKLMTTKEVAKKLEINECTLSREFKKYKLPGPKRILMYLKVHHAMQLMSNDGLSKSEIAILSGFSNERRLEECIQRLSI